MRPSDFMPLRANSSVRHSLRRIGATFVLALAALGAASARAQSVHWEMGESALENVVQLVFENCEPDGDPQLPPPAAASLRFAGQSQSSQYSFGSSGAVNTRTITLSYIVQSRQNAPLKIPAFTVQTKSGPMRVSEFDATVAATVAASVASSKLVPERTSVWAGEVFGLAYELTAARRNNPQINPTFEWSPAPLVAEEWPKPELNETVADGQRQFVVTYHTRAYAKTPGHVRLQAASHLLNIQTGSMGFSFMPQARMEPVSVTSDQPVVEVRPLPPAPDGFSGAVGQFKLVSKVVPGEVAVGEPVTWTLELSGTGNWPDIPGLPAREASKDFQVVQPKAKRAPAEGKLFEATLTEDVVLVPTKPGRYTLGPVAFTFFNPRTGAYETVRANPATVTIAAPATAPAASGAPQPAASGTAAGAQATAAAARPPSTPPAPAGIPRDPLSGRGDAALPLADANFVSWLLVPAWAFLVLWLSLAWRRAVQTDPLRPQREAHRRLAALLAGMRTISAAAGAPTAHRGQAAAVPAAPPPLLRWQHDAAVLWRIPHAAPAANAIADIEWATLWREADRVLYGPDAALPSDWLPRAEAALAQKRLPAFKSIRLFLPKNLLPFAAAIALLPAALAPDVHAAAGAAMSPAAAYRVGEFTQAEASWRKALSERPTDWIARHNLSLALTQQGCDAEAAAQAAAAFVQHPRDPAVRWHFGFAAEKAGCVPAPLSPFLEGGPVAEIATAASPAGWQRILITAAFVTAAALGWMLVNAYGRRIRLQFWAAGVVCLFGTLTALVSRFGWSAYGQTADVRAVIVWRAGTLRSIPTEADTTQKTTSLAAGSVGVIDNTYLGWDRLVFANGQTGWVRHEEVVLLWR